MPVQVGRRLWSDRAHRENRTEHMQFLRELLCFEDWCPIVVRIPAHTDAVWSQCEAGLVEEQHSFPAVFCVQESIEQRGRGRGREEKGRQRFAHWTSSGLTER